MNRVNTTRLARGEAHGGAIKSDILRAAHALNGRVSGGRVRFAPPGHSRSDNSAAVWFDPTSDDGIQLAVFSPKDDPRLVREFVRERLGLLPTSGAPRPHSALATGPERMANALSIWDQARAPQGTPVEAYLHRRSLDLSLVPARFCIRYHPECPFGAERTPAMVCLVRDVVTNEPKAIHRTALTRDGRKVQINGKDRLALGPVAGGAVKFTPDEDVTVCLGIGEGIETTLSLRKVPEFGSSPLWSLLSAGGVERFPVLPGIESLWIAVDHDKAGLESARSTASRWQAADREVFLITPSAPCADLNDLLIGESRHG